MTAQTQKLDPWFIYREPTAPEMLAAANHWREFASEPTNGTEYLRQLCVETAERLEAEAAALAGGAA